MRTALRRRPISHIKRSSSSEMGKSYLGCSKTAPTLRGPKIWYVDYSCIEPTANGCSNVHQSSTGYYRSTFVVETLAVHFEHSSTRPTATQVHPAGALVLTLTAVSCAPSFLPKKLNNNPQLERALKSWVTGEHVAPAGKFSSADCKTDTQVWMKGVGSYSVSRWKRLLTAVEDLNPSAYKTPGPSASATGTRHSPTYDPRAQAPPSSGRFFFSPCCSIQLLNSP